MDSSDFNYKKYSLEHLENWVHDAIDCEDLTPQDIYDTIVKCVDENIEYHKKYLTKNIDVLSLLRGHREFEIDTTLDDMVGYDGWSQPYDSWDYDAAGAKIPRVCDKDDPSPECQKAWNDFWEESYYPEEYEKTQYTEEELNVMCDAVEKQSERDKCREYNLREAEYYNQRAKLDAEVEAIKAAGGYEWTPDPAVSRNDPNRLKYEEGWVYESPDRGKTVTRRRVGSTEKEIVKADGYSTSEKKTWTLPVEESNIDGVKDYYITFPDDLLKAADLKEGDTVEWIDRKDGSYELRKSLSCPPCPPCDTLSCVDHLADD